MPSDNNAANVAVGKGKVAGYVYAAPLGSTAPTDASTALNAAFKCLGYISEDGLTVSISDDNTPSRDMNGTVVYNIFSNHTETFSFTLLETKADVLKEAFGDDAVTIDGSGNITVTTGSVERESKMYVFELVLTNGLIKRTYIPNGKVTELGEIVHKAGELLDYPLTITAQADTNGDCHTDWYETA